jgi:hypothetical protein
MGRVEVQLIVRAGSLVILHEAPAFAKATAGCAESVALEAISH